MAVNKITEVTSANTLKDEASILVTQQETVGGQNVEALRRVTLDKLLEVTGSAEDDADLESRVSILEPAGTSSDVGKALVVHSVSDGKATAYRFASIVARLG